MTIVRELVTKLSFQVDKRGIENFNRSIIGFKTKFALATTAVAGFITGVVKAVSSVSDAVLDTTELARATGIATKEFVGLQRAAGQFRISPQQFSNAFLRLNDLIRDAEFGFGQLFDIANQLGIEIRDDNNALLGTRDIFEKIIDSLSRIQDESLRIDIAKRIFGEGRFSDVAKEGINNLNELANSLTPLGEQIANAEQKALNFDRSFTRLGDRVKELAFEVFPPAFDALSNIFESVSFAIDKTRSEGFLSYFQLVGAALSDKTKELLGFETHLERIKRETEVENAEFERNLQQAIQNLSPEARERFVNRRVDINTKIEVQPPVGTEEAQREFFQSAAKEAFTESFNDRFEEILDNFPEVE